jgi:hypothetical protein
MSILNTPALIVIDYPLLPCTHFSGAER